MFKSICIAIVSNIMRLENNEYKTEIQDNRCLLEVFEFDFDSEKLYGSFQ